MRNQEQGASYVKARRRNVRLTTPVGHPDAALLFDNQLNDSASAIDLLTTSEAAGFLKISASGVRRLQQGRHIPFFKVGGSIRFAKSDLASYLARRRVESVST